MKEYSVTISGNVDKYILISSLEKLVKELKTAERDMSEITHVGQLDVEILEN